MQRHNTPLSLCALATPPQFRRRVDVYRESMDPKVAEDTAPIHWVLDKDQTIDFLAKLFPDDRLFPPSSTAPGGIKSIITHMNTLWQRINDRWAYCPDMSKPDDLEEKVAQFFNRVVQHVPDSYLCTRRWTGRASNNPVDGLSGAIRKPDLLLCEEGIITTRDTRNEKFDMRTDVYAMGEVKKKYSEDNKKESYVELAGKVAFLLEAQDGRCATPGIRLLGTHVILTLFDRGGSISTHPLDIHQFPDEFLRILLGITFADGIILGFDSTISPAQNNRKEIRISVKGKEYTILVDTLLFFSGSLHGQGTTVWKGKVAIDKVEEDVVVKDTWVDPLRQHTEGRILRMLEKACVKHVPKLVHEQQVQTQHPVTRDFLNHSTHILRLLVDGCPPSLYRLRVLSRLVSKPRGFPIFDFHSLSELLVGIIDCLLAHHDAFKKAGVLHRDISLFNLLLVLMQDSSSTDFINRVLQEPERTEIRARIQSISRRGLLGDWGFAVPVAASSSDSLTLGATPAVRVDGEKEPLSRAHLKDTHSIVIPVADSPLPNNVDLSTDASPLHRTGTWAWMAAELSHVGPGTPVVHQVHHDLESFFYILLAICLLYDIPGELKSPKVLSQCFDPFFAITHPSTLKIVTIQSDFGWTALMLPHVSQYFQPLIPLLEEIRKQLILPIKFQRDKIQANLRFTHDDFIDAIVVVLSKLPNHYWVAKEPSKSADAVSQNTRSSNTAPILSLPSTAPSTVLPNHPLPRLPLIRMSNTSSSSSSKRRLECEDEVNSPTTKRRSQVGGTSSSDQPLDLSSTSTSWIKVDASSPSSTPTSSEQVRNYSK